MPENTVASRHVGTPTHVYIHGFLDNANAWTSLIERDQIVARNALALDLRGAGTRQGDTGPFTLKQAVADVVALVAAQQLESIVLIGHSMGAQVAELAALELGPRVTALILITPVSLAGISLPLEAVALLRAAGGDAPAQARIRQGFSRNLSQNAIERLVDADVLMRKETVEGYFDAFSGGDMAGLKATAYSGPILILAAKDDPVVPVDAIMEMRSNRFPSARIVEIEGAGHWPHLERPAETAAAISDFLYR